MKFSLKQRGIGRIADFTTKSNKNEANEMDNGVTNIQLNTSSAGSLVIKNSTRLLGGLVLAGMVAVATVFGSVSADSPSVTTSFTAHGPNEMDIEFLNKLGRVSFVAHGPNEMDIEYLSKLGVSSFLPHGPNGMDVDYLSKLGVSSFLPHGPNGMDVDYLSKLGVSSFLPHGPNGMDVDYLS